MAKQADLTLALGEELIAGGEPLLVSQSVAESALNLATARSDLVRERAAVHLGIAATVSFGGAAGFATPLGSEWVKRGRELQIGWLCAICQRSARPKVSSCFRKVNTESRWRPFRLR